MFKKVSVKKMFLAAFAAFFIFQAGAYASKNAANGIEDLKKQVELLQKQITALEKENTALKNNSGIWNPCAEVARMQATMDSLFQNSLKQNNESNGILFTNTINYDDTFKMKNEKDKYVIQFDVKDFNKEKISVNINDTSITLKGEKSYEKTEEKSKDSYIKSKSFESFMKTLPIPADVDKQKIKYELAENTLTVTLPKK
jgi:HSP20 family protein